MSYNIPPKARIGHVHLKVSDLKRSLDFYTGVLGFEIVMQINGQAAFISAGGYHHHIGLNTWHSKNGQPAPKNTAGLYHVAILYPTRKDLAAALKQLNVHGYPVSGAADHGVSEAIYLNDPDENGLELYWDRPKDQWPKDENGKITMYTRSLDLNDLLLELEKE